VMAGVDVGWVGIGCHWLILSRAVGRAFGI
jgi:hypothetical protein